MIAEVCMSSSVSVCTSDRLARREDGKALGLECVTMTLEEVSRKQSLVRATSLINQEVMVSNLCILRRRHHRSKSFAAGQRNDPEDYRSRCKRQVIRSRPW